MSDSDPRDSDPRDPNPGARDSDPGARDSDPGARDPNPGAWQTVFHFHLHVIPRYEGDPLRLPWTPAEGDKEEIEAAAAALR